MSTPTELHRPHAHQSQAPSPPKAAHVLFATLLFLIAFLPRAIEPVSRPLVWYLRSSYFIDDVIGGSWASTVYSEHPGVALMWPAGVGLKAYWAVSDTTPAASQVPPGFEPIHFRGPVPSHEIAAALALPAGLIAAGIAAAYLMLRHLLGEAIAAIAAMLLALSPYHLAQSKVLHLDALMATLMLLSALALLRYRTVRQWRWLIISGALGGVALLTKIPAVFLAPYCGLVLLVDLALQRERTPRDVLSRLAIPVLGWVITAALVYVALWPVMWVDPGKGVAAVTWGISRHSTTAHDTPTLFLGEMMHEDPGPLFYVVSLLFRMSEVELTFLAMAAVVAVSHLLRAGKLSEDSVDGPVPTPVDLLLLSAYAIAYLAQMSLGAKKMPRYVLPSLMALSILAATGIAAWANALATGERRIRTALMVLPIVLHAAVTLPRHPYYGTALNWLAGGPPGAADAILIGEEGEGYAELSEHLNARPDAENLIVAAQLQHVFNQRFDGTVVELDPGHDTPLSSVDYVAFHRNYTSRNYKAEQWGRLWERYAARTPEREVVFDRVPYAWLYPRWTPDEGPEHSTLTHFGEPFTLLGHDWRDTEARPGDRVPVVLYWRATRESDTDFSIFLHLLDTGGEIIWQDDGAADHGRRPTWSWTPDEIVVDPHTIVVPHDLPSGSYQLIAGLYDWRTGQRLPVWSEDGVVSDHAAVATLTVRQPATPPQVWLSRALAGLVLIAPLAARVKGPRFRPAFLALRDSSR